MSESEIRYTLLRHVSEEEEEDEDTLYEPTYSVNVQAGVMAPRTARIGKLRNYKTCCEFTSKTILFYLFA